MMHSVGGQRGNFQNLREAFGKERNAAQTALARKLYCRGTTEYVLMPTPSRGPPTGEREIWCAPSDDDDDASLVNS